VPVSWRPAGSELAVALALALVGCVRPQAQTCGDRVCDVGDVCTLGGCATPGDVAACAGLADGTSCMASNGGTGTCDQGACHTDLCGNGRLDPGEVCDGALGVDPTANETCSPDCKTIYRCGNTIVDPGEQCDDGNTNPADGCDMCRLTQWNAYALIGNSATASSTALSPIGIAFDHNHNLYIADTLNNRIRKVDAGGVISSVAGNGVEGFTGDGGPATSAELDQPYGIAVDGLGNLYIADTNNNRIREVEAVTGTITTIAGSGPYSGYSGDFGPATSAVLNQPAAVTVDGLGSVYIADTYNSRIRLVSGGIITTIAGTGTAGFSGDGGAAIVAQINYPIGIALDASRNLFVADQFNGRIRRVDTSGTITTFAGGGSSLADGVAATAAQLGNPTGVAFDNMGGLLISDNQYSDVRRVSAGVITTIAGVYNSPGFSGDGGLAINAQLAGPGLVATDAGDVYMSDIGNNRIRRIDGTGLITTFAGNGVTTYNGDGGSATSAQLTYPVSVAVDATGNVLIADCYTTYSRIVRVDPAGIVSPFVGTGVVGFSGDGGAAASAQIAQLSGIALDPSGNLYIADAGNDRVRKVSPGGSSITTIAGTGSAGYSGDGGAATGAQLAAFIGGIAVDASANVFISDGHRIRRIDATTGIITTIAGTGVAGFSGDNGPATAAQLNSPGSLAVDAVGNVYVADEGNKSIRRIGANGVITTVASSLVEPFSAGVDAAGNVFIGEPGSYTLPATSFGVSGAVLRVDAVTGAVTQIAKGNEYGFNGDGGPAAVARLNDVTSVAVDAAGNVYFADASIFAGVDTVFGQAAFEHVRRIDAAGTITTIAGQVDPEGMGSSSRGHLADPRALVVSPPYEFFAGGATGTIQRARFDTNVIAVVAGRYPQETAVSNLARYRGELFGSVSGVAYDASAGLLYLSEAPTRNPWIPNPLLATVDVNRIDVVTVVDPANPTTWTIAPLATAAGTPGFVDGPVATALFRKPSGLYLDSAARVLYVADTGNYVIRAIDLATNTVTTVAGTPAVLGDFGDGGPATMAGLYQPKAITKCGNGDLFIADTGNNRVRRVYFDPIQNTNVIATVLGDGTAASSGDGAPSRDFPVDAPLGVSCDAFGNVYVSSTTTVRLLAASDAHVVDGKRGVYTIYGAAPRTDFPASVTSCLSGVAVIDGVTVQVVDSCTGLLVQLHRDYTQ
jgi:cysteine-rich repeat protein